MKVLSRFFRLSFFHFKASNSLFDVQTAILLTMVSPLFQFVFFLFMANFFTQTQDLSFWIVGNTILVIIIPTVWSVANFFRRERLNGTLKYVFCTTINTPSLLLGVMVIPCGLALVQMLFGLGIGCVFFHLRFEPSLLPLYMANLLIVAFSSAMFGIAIASFGLYIPQMHVLLNLAYSSLMIFSGANYPISIIPRPLRWISHLLPMSRGIEAARKILEHLYPGELMLKEMGIGICYLVLGFFLLKFAQYMAKKHGTLELY